MRCAVARNSLAEVAAIDLAGALGAIAADDADAILDCVGKLRAMLIALAR